MSHPKNQHYVPQFLLRAFENRPGSDQVHTYDKHTGNAFPANVRNVGAEKAFYDAKVDETLVTFEPALSELETATSTLISRILKQEQIGFLSADDR